MDKSKITFEKSCSKCGITKALSVVRTSHRADGSQVRVCADDTGRKWQSAICPDCNCKRIKAYMKGVRYTPDDFANRKFQRGRASEKIAAEFLRSLGAENVQLSSTFRGPDITFQQGPNQLNVEVKTAVRNGNSWQVGKVSIRRREDDLIAVVFDDGHVALVTMREHLSGCSPSGVRAVGDYRDRLDVYQKRLAR